jgi:beta-D-xylosidase 4
MLLNVQVATSALLLFVNLNGVGAATPPYTRPDCSKKPLSSNGICDITKSPAKRAAALVAAMTPEEKVGNLVR